MMRNFSHRPRRAPLFLTASALVLMAGFGLTQLRVHDVTCQDDRQQECPTEVVSQLHSLKGQSLIFANIETQTSSLLAETPTHRLKTIQKLFPDTVVIELESQQLLYQLKLLGQSEYRTVTDTGSVIVGGRTDGLILLVVSADLWDAWQSAGMVDPFVQESLSKLPLLLAESGIQTEALVLIDAQTLVMYLPNNQTAIIDTAELPGDLARLTVILDELQSQPLEQPIEEIDVRYDLPVLRPVRNIPRHQLL